MERRQRSLSLSLLRSWHNGCGALNALYLYVTMIITIINIWRGECHYNLPYLHRPHDSGPIQRARGDFRLKPSAAARPPARSVSLFLFQSRNVEKGRHEEQGMRQKTERKGEDERKKAQRKGCKSPSQKEGGDARWKEREREMQCVETGWEKRIRDSETLQTREIWKYSKVV